MLRLDTVAHLWVGGGQRLADGHRRQWRIAYPVPSWCQRDGRFLQLQLLTRYGHLFRQLLSFHDGGNLHLVHRGGLYPGILRHPVVAVAENHRRRLVLDEDLPWRQQREYGSRTLVGRSHAQSHPVPILVQLQVLLHVGTLCPDDGLVERTPDGIELEGVVNGRTVERVDVDIRIGNACRGIPDAEADGLAGIGVAVAIDGHRHVGCAAHPLG